MSPVATRSQEALDKAAEEAEMLEAVKAQARAEEKIGHRLPREVVNLAKRLDLQQLSMDNLQGNISTLTEMVAQIGMSLHVPSHNQRHIDPTPESSGVNFTTLPHQPKHLSPIYEGETPESTPALSATLPVPSTSFPQPHPSQIPHPRFSPSTTKPQSSQQQLVIHLYT
jgi:hypothetical protein